MNRVCTYFSRSNSSNFQALLRVIFKFQHLNAVVKYVCTGTYFTHDFFSLLITIMYIVLCCKHLKWCFIIAKTLEIKGEQKVLSKKREATWRSSGTLAPRQRETWEHPVIFFFDTNHSCLLIHQSLLYWTCLQFNLHQIHLLLSHPSLLLPGCICNDTHAHAHTHTDFISPCNKQTIQSDPSFAKTQRYNVKHFQALN